MKKLALNIEELEVETFSTDGTAPQRGTVRARSDGPWYTDCMYYWQTFCIGCPPPESELCPTSPPCYGETNYPTCVAEECTDACSSYTCVYCGTDAGNTCAAACP